MVERIIPATEALAERERKAIDDMRALFPDGNVSGLDTKDKALGKRLSKLYVSLGYDSRADMIEALGFRQDKTNLGGRPVTFDPEAIISELQDRYDGMPKPKALDLLKKENPDLKGSIRTLQNKSNELFGRSLAKELVARGLLSRGNAGEKSELSDDELLEGLCRLEEKYSDSAERVKTLSELRSKDEEAKAIIDALDNNRSRRLLGATPAKYFKSRGILGDGICLADASEIEAAIDALSELSKGVPDEDKPKSIADACIRYPEYAGLIKAGQQKKLITKSVLFERGILGMTQAARKSQEKLMRERCVRNAEVLDLVRMYRGSGGRALTLPEDNVSFLRPGVIGLDIASGYELRESTFLSLRHVDVVPGDRLDVGYGSGGEWSFSGSVELAKKQVQVANVARPDHDYVAHRPYDVSTKLSDYVSNEVVDVVQAGTRTIIRIRHRFLNPITTETMIFALHAMGAITDEELLGGDSWRDRLETMPTVPE